MDIRQVLNRVNIVDLIDKVDLVNLKSNLLKQYAADLQSRKEENQKLDKIMNMGLLNPDPKDAPFQDCSNIVFPLTAISVYEFWAKSVIEIVADDVVKPKVIGKDEGIARKNEIGEVITDPETGQPILDNVRAKFRRGERVAAYMNWQLTCQMRNWRPDMRKLLSSQALLGTMFTKSCYDSLEKKPEIYPVYPDKIIINDKARSLNDAMITHVLELYENEVVERIRTGLFIEFNYKNDDQTNYVINLDTAEEKKPGIETGMHTFLEIHCNKDLDKDGYPEPYVVTIHQTTGTVVRIMPRCKKKGIKTNNRGQIVKIEAENLFTIYPLFPNPNGSLYGLGFGQLLFNTNESINTSINQLFDAGTMQNYGGGLIDGTLKIKSGNHRIGFNEYKQVDAMGTPLDKAFIRIPAPEPCQTTFNLLTFLSESGKELGMLRDLLTGDQMANMPATNALTMTDQAIKPFKALYQGIYESLKCDFRKIFEMNAEYLSDKEYAEVIDETIENVSVKQDFNSKDFDIVPVADIDSIMTVQRMSRANLLMTFINDPYLDGMEIRKRILEAANIPDIDKLLIQPQPQPDPLVQMEMVKQENRAKEIEIEAIKQSAALEKGKLEIPKLQAEIEALKAKALRDIAEAEGVEKGRQLQQYQATLDWLHKQSQLELQQQESERQAEQIAKEQAQQEQQVETQETVEQNNE